MRSMGLDNMITVRAKEKYRDEIPEEYEDIRTVAEWQYKKHGIDDTVNYEGSYGDIGYWRKSWGFRNKVMEYLGNKYDEVDEYHYTLDLDDLKQISIFLHDCVIDPNEDCSNIWTWREMIHHNADIFANLHLLIHDISTGAISMDEVEVEWIDSY